VSVTKCCLSVTFIPKSTEKKLIKFCFVSVQYAPTLQGAYLTVYFVENIVRSEKWHNRVHKSIRKISRHIEYLKDVKGKIISRSTQCGLYSEDSCSAAALWVHRWIYDCDKWIWRPLRYAYTQSQRTYLENMLLHRCTHVTVVYTRYIMRNYVTQCLNDFFLFPCHFTLTTKNCKHIEFSTKKK
jgi:hypothetical protein